MQVKTSTNIFFIKHFSCSRQNCYKFLTLRELFHEDGRRKTNFLQVFGCTYQVSQKFFSRQNELSMLGDVDWTRSSIREGGKIKNTHAVTATSPLGVCENVRLPNHILGLCLLELFVQLIRFIALVCCVF